MFARLKNKFKPIKTQILSIENGDILVLKFPGREPISEEAIKYNTDALKIVLEKVGKGDTPILVGCDFELMVLRPK